MIAKTLLPLLSLAGAVLAEPIPQAAATTSSPSAAASSAAASDGGAAATSFATAAFPSGAVPSFNTASIASLEASLSSMEAFYSSLTSGEPTLPASIESAVLSAIPTSIAVSQIGCEIVGNIPDWYASLPANVKSALTSYEYAFSTWYAAHSTDFPSYTGTDTATLSGGNPFAGCTAVTVAVGSGLSTTVPVNGGGATTTGGSSPKSTGTGTSAGSAGVSSTSKAGAAAPTGAVAVGFAGLVGMLGLMVAL